MLKIKYQFNIKYSLLIGFLMLHLLVFAQEDKTLLTASISTTNGEELSKTPVPTLIDAIQGKVTGLTTLRNTGSEPGYSNSDFYVRGIGTFGGGRSPLFIVDNVVRSVSVLDPDEIESFSILKDAAATVNYGMRAANGVISVKTKRGLVGKPVVSLKAEYGFQQPTRLPNYLGSREYVKFRNIALQNDGLPIPSDPRYDESMYDGTQNPYLYANTDWYGEFIKKAAPQQIYRINVAGGTETVRYYVMLGTTIQDGIYNFTNENEGYTTNPKYNRYNIRSNVDIDLSQYLTLSLDLAGRMETKRYPGASASTIFTALSQMPPTVPIKNEDGSIAGTSVYTFNPYGLIAKRGYTDQYQRYLQGNVSANYKLDFWVKGLSANAMYAFDTYKNYARYKGQSFAVYQQNLNSTFSKFGEDSSLDMNFYNAGDGYTLQSTFIGGFNYVTEIANIHKLAAELKYMQLQYDLWGSEPTYKNQDIFGHLTYAFDNRYVAEFSFSHSGSQNFINENRYKFFPAGSVAWIISNESFLENNATINFLKLRASYGMVGNDDLGVGRFPFEGKYGADNGYPFGTGYAWSDGSYEGRIKNVNIGCETSLNANIGVDVEMFKNKLGFSIDVFRHDRSNIITTRENTMTSIIGQALPYENRGSVLNQGFEVSLLHRNKIGDVGYYAQANVSYAANEITYMEELSGQESWLYHTGRSVTQQWGFESLGFFNNQAEIDGWAKSTFGTVKPGDIKYKDQNKDNLIDINDAVPLGKPFVPEWNFGLTLGADYKNFDINILFSGIANRTIFNYSNVFLGIQGNNNATATVYDAWQAGVNETTAKYPRLSTEYSAHNNNNSNVWSHNGNYLRIQNAEIGYNLPEKILAKINMQSARIFVNGYNLLSFDHFSKYNMSAEYPDAGIFAYPETKVYNLGVNIKF